MSHDEAIRQFLARGGRVQKVETGANSGFTARDWHHKARGEHAPDENELIAQRIVRGDVVYNGLGEVIGRI